MRHIGMGLILLPHVGWAAGSSETGALQQLRPSTTIYLDVLSNKETLSWFGQIETSTGDVTAVDVEVYAPSGDYLTTWSSGTTARSCSLLWHTMATLSISRPKSCVTTASSYSLQ